MLSALMDLLFPLHCHFCRRRLGDGDVPFLCAAHAAALPPHENAEPGLLCLYRYEGDLPQLLHAFKYDKKRYLIRCFDALLKRHFSRAGAAGAGECELIVPVPIAPQKEKERGFNQAALLAASAAAALGIPLTARALKREEGARPSAQASLSREKRLENVRGTVRPGREAGRVEGRNVLLVDDVVTTGATVAECARALSSLGARRVTALALARTPLHLINSQN